LINYLLFTQHYSLYNCILEKRIISIIAKYMHEIFAFEKKTVFSKI